MAVAWVQEFEISGDDRSTNNYDALTTRIDVEGNPPDGLIADTAGWDEEGGVFRVFSIWDTAEQQQRFLQERLQPLLAEGPVNPDNAAMPDRDGTYDLHHVFQG